MAKKQEQDGALLDEEGHEALRRLEDQVDKAVGLIRELRKERSLLEGRVEELQATVDGLEEKADRATMLEQQQSTLEDEKAEIRKRIESILEKFEELDGEG